MTMSLKKFFVENWKAKLVSLFIATSIWYLIKSHLDSNEPAFPVPGTGTTPAARPVTGPVLDDTLLGPLITPPPTLPAPRSPTPAGSSAGR
jgi:hypothetical protein